jgi:transposase
MRPSGTPEALEARRLVAARLLAQGASPTEVAATVGCSKSSASRWKQAWKEGGVEALRPKRHPGPEPKLDLSQQRRLLAALQQGTAHWGYTQDGWTGPLVRDLIRRLFGVEYHVDYVGTLLHKLGWSPQKPERRARERNERAIARWRRDVWPRLKKEPSAAS